MALRRDGARRIVWLAMVFEASLLVFALPAGWLLGVSPFDDLDLTVQAAAAGFGATVPLLLLMLLFTRVSWSPFRRLMRELDEHLLPLFRHSSTLELALVALAAGLGEEAFFRGAIQGGVTHISAPLVGLAVASVLFGLAHLITPTYAVLAGLVGLYLGGLFLLTGNLLVPMVVHATYDFVALSYWIHSRADERDSQVSGIDAD
jgi:membrane protease YdiL (CAAX protease family)